MPTGKAIRISSTTKVFRPSPTKKVKVKKLPVLHRVTAFGVANKLSKLKLPVQSSGPSETPLGEIKEFSLRSLKSAVARLRGKKPTRILKNVSQLIEGENVINYKMISQTEKQYIQGVRLTQVPYKTVADNIIQKSAGRIVLNPGDLGFYGFNGSEWVPFKTPTFSLATILKTGGNAGGESLVNVNAITSNSVNATQMNVDHVTLDYWNPAFTLNLNGNNIYNVNNLSANVITTTLYIGNYSSFERSTTTISGDVLYSLIDKGSVLDYEWNAHSNRVTRPQAKQGCADVSSLGELVMASSYATLGMLFYDIAGSSTSLTFTDLGATIGPPTDVFLVKYNADGTVAWKNRLASTSLITARGISTNNSVGNILLTGGVNTSSLLINDVTGNAIATINYSTNDGYLMRFTTNGVYVWNTRATSTGGNVVGYSVAVNDANTIVATGTFNENVTLFGTSGANYTLAGTGANCYLARYSNAGVIQWVTRFTANISFDALDVDLTNDGTIYVGGSNLNSFIRFYSAGDILSTVVIPNYGGGFLAKYNSEGAFQWASYILGGFSTSLRASSDNEVVVAGYFQNLLRVYSPNVVAPFTLQSSTPASFLVKYNNAGDILWLTKITGSPITQTNWVRVNINNFNQVVILGSYSQPGDPIQIFAAGATVAASTLPPNGGSNSFIVNYNSNGTYNWASRLSSSSDIQNYSVILQSSNEIFVTGTMNSTLNIYTVNGITLVDQISNSLGNDVYVIKYTPTINSVLGTPTLDGQTKVIASAGPKSFITSAGNFNNQSGKTIVLGENQSVRLLWSAPDTNWIIQKNSGQLV